MRITVVNKTDKERNGAVYIGRAGRGSAGSPLANPRRLGDPKPGGGVWKRGETIELFEVDLRQVLDPMQPTAQWWVGRRGCYRTLTSAERQAIRDEMTRLYALANQGPLELDCFCKPLACHGDVIRKLLEEKHAARAGRAIHRV